MSVNREEFNLHMDAGHNAAWDQDWMSAIEAYSQAIQMVPEDPDAHINLGLALLNDGQLDRALKIFKRANQLSPDDPVPLERCADVLERMGMLKEAAQQYIKVSDVYLAQRDLNKAIGNWERATQLTPGLVNIHARLAQAYERVGDKKQAIREYITLAFNFQRLDDVDKATRAVERALRLDKDNAQALNTLRALKAGVEVVLPDEANSSRSMPRVKEAATDAFGMPEEPAAPSVGESDPLGPIGEALNAAMGILAMHVVEVGLDSSVGFAMQGMEYQRQGFYAEAIRAYTQANEAGLLHPALKLNLGGLMSMNDQAKAAIPHLMESLSHPGLNAGALHAIGKTYFILGDQRNAANFLIRCLEAVDTSLALDDNEMDELKAVYSSLMTALEGRPDNSLYIINERFIGLLSGKDWKQRIADTRRHLDETLRDEGDQGLVDFLVAKGGDSLAESVTMIDQYIRQGLFTLAMDEAHRAVEHSPYYLPIHVRMAEVMMKEGRIRQAINKYTTVARSYLVRGENDRAALILTDVLEMAPLDVEVRTYLIELLEMENRLAEALDQYIDMANTYQQLGDFERAGQTLQASERLARRIEAPASKLVEIKFALADISQMRLNTRQAQRIYEEIIEIIPEEEKALRSLVDIYLSQANHLEMIKRLDALLGIYARKGMVTRITQTLDDLVRSYPAETALRVRLASIYRKLGQVTAAIEQLDALGELQLDAGLNKDAANTIRQIIQLKPDRIEEYRRLLQQLNG